MFKVVENGNTLAIVDLDPEARNERPTLDQVVADIAIDARHEPLAYARETLVPEGGE